MKQVLLFVCVLGLVFSSSMPGYILNHSNTGSMKPQANKEQYSQQSFADLLKYNFQVLSKSSNASDLIEEFGKGNLLNPVELNYMFIIEGQEKPEMHADHARVELASSDSILDTIFSQNFQSESLLKLANQFFPQEKRAPFYLYSQNNNQNALEKSFGVRLERDASSNELFMYDTKTQKQIGKKFELSQCISNNFPEYVLKRDTLTKKNSSMSLEITESNAKSVESLLKDLCAVSKLSQMFRKSAQPNFIVFALDQSNLPQGEIIDDLIKNMYKKVSANFENTLGLNNVFGEVLYTTDFNQMLAQVSEEDLMKPRILLSEDQPEVQENEQQVHLSADIDTNVSAKQFQWWFSLGFILVLFFVIYGLFTMEMPKDTLLYAKFIVADSGR